MDISHKFNLIGWSKIQRVYVVFLLLYANLANGQMLNQQQTSQEYNNQQYYNQQEQQYQSDNENMYENEYYNQQQYQEQNQQNAPAGNTNDASDQSNKVSNEQSIQELEVQSLEEINQNNINAPFNFSNLPETNTVDEQASDSTPSSNVSFSNEATNNIEQNTMEDSNQPVDQAENIEPQNEYIEQQNAGYYSPKTDSSSIEGEQTNQFSGALPVPGTRRELDSMEAPVEYTVKPGDTLYDICDQLVDEPVYWPKLWALNPDIRNPHIIRPGTKLRFFAGNDAYPPYLNVVQESNIVPETPQPLPEIVEQLITPVAETLVEEASVEFDLGGDKFRVLSPDEISVPTDSGFEIAQTYAYPTTRPITLPGRIYKKHPKRLGVIIGGVEGTISGGSSGDYLINGSSGSPLEVGSTYMVVSPVKKLRDGFYKRSSGYYYDYKGKIVIEQEVPGEEGMFKSRSTSKIKSMIDAGDLLIEDQDMVFNVPATPDQPNIKRFKKPVGIVSFGNSFGSIASKGSLVYLKLGNESISAGQSVNLFNKVGEYAVKPMKGKYPKHLHSKVAIAKILQQYDGYAVGVITHAGQQALHKNGYAK